MLNKILVDLRLARLEAIKDPKKLVACPECKEQLIGDKFLIHSESHFKLPKKKGSRLKLRSTLFPEERILCSECGHMITGQKYIQHMKDHKKKIKKITEKDINSGLYTKGQSDVDLLIRTGGQQRMSNFLLWQSAYAELFFSKKLWPDFDEKIFVNALYFFQNTERKFGSVSKST